MCRLVGDAGTNKASLAHLPKLAQPSLRNLRAPLLDPTPTSTACCPRTWRLIQNQIIGSRRLISVAAACIASNLGWPSPAPLFMTVPTLCLCRFAHRWRRDQDGVVKMVLVRLELHQILACRGRVKYSHRGLEATQRMATARPKYARGQKIMMLATRFCFLLPKPSKKPHQDHTHAEAHLGALPH